MRLRTVLLALLALLMAGLGAAAWLLPARIDWRERRAEIEAAAAGVLGRPVQLREEFSLRLLPTAAVAARGLSVVDVGDGFSVEAAEVRLGLRFWPLLAGRVIATDIVLVRPTIVLSGVTPPAFPTRLAPPWIAQADVRIEDGTITIAGFTVQGVAARVSGDGPGGPFALEGEATEASRRMRFQARLDRADAAGTGATAMSTASNPSGFEGARIWRSRPLACVRRRRWRRASRARQSPSRSTPAACSVASSRAPRSPGPAAFHRRSSKV